MKKIVPFILLALLLWAGVPALYAQFGGGGAVGACSGDLTGTYPNCTVAKINGASPAAVATSGSASDLSAGTLNSAQMAADS